ncbi:MAG: DUF5407 family protein [Verrucomicrobia bacterium]|nr:DUF5407 family protein [Verrucomicrobiota bacterium]
MAGGGFTDPWSGATITQGWLFGGRSPGQTSIQFSYLVNTINLLTSIAKSKIATISSKKSAMSIADMFDLQMAMNQLSQFSEMSTSVISAANTSIMSLARNIK